MALVARARKVRPLTAKGLRLVHSAYRRSGRGLTKIQPSSGRYKHYTQDDIEDAAALVIEMTLPATPIMMGRRPRPIFMAYVIRRGRWTAQETKVAGTPAAAARKALG